MTVGSYSPDLVYIGQNGPLPISHADLIPELKSFRDALETAWVSPEGDRLTVIVDLLHPLSRSGVVTLRSADPVQDPSIHLDFLEDELDIIALR